METVPLEVLEMTIMNMEPKEILNLCETSVYYKQTVCRNEKLWKSLLLRDFPERQNRIKKHKSWMKTYKAAYLREGEIKESVSKILENLRNNSYPEEWGIGFDPLEVENPDQIPIKEFRSVLVKTLKGDDEDTEFQVIIPPMGEGMSWLVDIETISNGALDREDVDITEKDLQELLYYLVKNQIKLHDVLEEDILDKNYVI